MTADALYVVQPAVPVVLKTDFFALRRVGSPELVAVELAIIVG